MKRPHDTDPKQPYEKDTFHWSEGNSLAAYLVGGHVGDGIWMAWVSSSAAAVVAHPTPHTPHPTSTAQRPHPIPNLYVHPYMAQHSYVSKNPYIAQHDLPCFQISVYGAAWPPMFPKIRMALYITTHPFIFIPYIYPLSYNAIPQGKGKTS